MLTATLRPLLTAAIITYRLTPVKSDFPPRGIDFRLKLREISLTQKSRYNRTK